MFVFIVRHGRTKANLILGYHSRIDNELDTLGIRQAKLAADYLSDKKICAIFSSPKKRALQTAKIIGDKIGIKAEKNEAFLEVNYGILDGKSLEEASV